MFNGLTTVNIELTTQCNKACPMCSRRVIERDYPELVNGGHMLFKLIEDIAKQLPSGIVVQFHDNGEPLMYPYFGNAISLFKRQIRCLDTNGKLLVKKADEIIGNLDTLTLSCFENDNERNEQTRMFREFMRIKGDRKPNVILRCLGDCKPPEDLRGITAHRILDYQMYGKGKAMIPEIGICLEVLNHLVIKQYGAVTMCVRFDPHLEGKIGDCTKESLEDIWNGDIRKDRIGKHIEGKRNEVPLCRDCTYWGIPI